MKDIDARILNAFNMAQDGYHVTLAMRRRGIEADLLIRETSDVFSHPAWEDGAFVVDNFKESLRPSLSKLNSWKKPEWMKIWRGHGWVGLLELRRLMRCYDIIIAHVPGSLYAMLFGLRYIPYDAGWIRYLPSLPPDLKRLIPTPSWWKGLPPTVAAWSYTAALSYRIAPRILFTNPDTIRLFNRAGLKDKLIFVPFAIDTDRYRPLSRAQVNSPLLNLRPPIWFSPARHSPEKGNALLLRGFAEFRRRNPDSAGTLALVEWGAHLDDSKALIKKLGIDNCIVWLNPMNKIQLIHTYNAVTAVLDQFVLGSWGTATPEAMACGRPVIMYYDPKWILACFSGLPPILNAKDPDKIAEALEMCLDESFAQKVGLEGREWVKRFHNSDLAVDIHMKVIKEILAY